uniref:Transmembrane protein 182 n=1 Tax=Mola mola TaxID=94237 RepID=A0A3Q3XQX2_MOLML
SLFTLLCCGTEYWLLASRSRSRTCGPTHEEEEETWLKLLSNSLGWRRHVTSLHQGQFWRCSFQAPSCDLTLTARPPSELCRPAFLFPFPVDEPRSATLTLFFTFFLLSVYRTFWSIFLVSGLMAVTAGGSVLICTCPLANRRLFKVGGAFQLCDAVLLMYLMWVQVLDTLEHSVQVQLGPSALLAPLRLVVFFPLLSGRSATAFTGRTTRTTAPPPPGSHFQILHRSVRER